MYMRAFIGSFVMRLRKWEKPELLTDTELGSMASDSLTECEIMIGPARPPSTRTGHKDALEFIHQRDTIMLR